MKWWQKAVFYQVYPRSFADGNGDGIGDLPGLIGKLDYLQDLGIDAIWLSPHYPSPMVDCGYDISDYCQVAPEYGSLNDFETLVDELHRRNMKIVLDLVLNHTSDQHPWFIKSRSSQENPKHDWYVWEKGDRKTLPNNWYSAFGGPAWEWNEATGEYYYHFFYKEQPDLNWQNPDVKKAMFDMVRFWLQKGVDGFRLDAVGIIFEESSFPNHSCLMTQDELFIAERMAKTDAEREVVNLASRAMYQHQHDQPEVHDLMKELRKVIDEFDDRVLIGETEDIAFYGDGTDELHLVFNFPLMWKSPLTADWILENQAKRLPALPDKAWPCNTLNNHDTGRVYSNFGDGKNDEALARLNLAVVLLLKGTPFLFNGEEIGMRNFYGFLLEQFRDPISRRLFGLEKELLGKSNEEALDYAARNGRDKGRTPIPWNETENAGFSPAGVQTWLPVNPDYRKGVHVKVARENPDSIWHFYRQLIQIRRQTRALLEGEYQSLSIGENCLSFFRITDGQKVLVLMNFCNQHLQFDCDLPINSIKVFSSETNGELSQRGGLIRLLPYEIWIGICN